MSYQEQQQQFTQKQKVVTEGGSSSYQAIYPHFVGIGLFCLFALPTLGFVFRLMWDYAGLFGIILVSGCIMMLASFVTYVTVYMFTGMSIRNSLSANANLSRGLIRNEHVSLYINPLDGSIRNLTAEIERAKLAPQPKDEFDRGFYAEKVTELYEHGHTPEVISQSLGITTDTVKDVLRDMQAFESVEREELK